ncbi:hypothetical protein SAMN05519103_06109 [Rhizobiales bacterium GAS113]|nr:hypothetical protein SAMN05519103_06109 [Rhizobiales bacterium GAS113]
MRSLCQRTAAFEHVANGVVTVEHAEEHETSVSACPHLQESVVFISLRRRTVHAHRNAAGTTAKET